MAFSLDDACRRWLEDAGPESSVVAASRVRYARNLAEFPFIPHGSPELMKTVDSTVQKAFAKSNVLSGFERVDLAALSSLERTFLKESRLIPKEMEKGRDGQVAYISPDGRAAILVNEEDHLRLQVMRGGLDILDALEELKALDEELAQVVDYAYSAKYGYLTACPTNVGTGFRASAMLHLPALAMLQEIDASLAGVAHYGLTVRGFYGENSDYVGDFFQLSNEVTLGKTVEQIVATLSDVIERLIEKEQEARLALFRRHRPSTDDGIWRSFGVLAYARQIDSTEAMRLLSKLRLGIDQGYFPALGHDTFNRLVVDIQPAHLERLKEQWDATNSRDEARAHYLRYLLKPGSEKTPGKNGNECSEDRD